MYSFMLDLCKSLIILNIFSFNFLFYIKWDRNNKYIIWFNIMLYFFRDIVI